MDQPVIRWGTAVSDENGHRRYPTREGKRAATTYFEPDEYRRLRVIAALQDKSLQDVILQACREFLARQEQLQHAGTGPDRR
jgi:hypothetical protein